VSLVTLGAHAHAAGPDAVGMLLECHQRIRQFSELAVRLASAGEVAPAEVRAAAQQLRRYFGEAFPLHVADEELSLRPRLERIGDRAVQGALAAMSKEHEGGRALLEPLLSDWVDLSGDRANPWLRTARAAEARRLQQLLDEHLALEESILFPAAAARLSPHSLEAIAEEMRARRSRFSNRR
jgi:hemerythrin-like domain-containing protein